MPRSKNPLAVNLVLGFGLSNLLNEGNIEGGMAPLDEGTGGACGGKIVVGGGEL